MDWSIFLIGFGVGFFVATFTSVVALIALVGAGAQE